MNELDEAELIVYGTLLATVLICCIYVADKLLGWPIL